MNNQKTVKSANGEKSAVLYIVTCALVVIQPLLDILSSIVINLGKANYISVSGAGRAVIIAAVTVFTLGFYKGKYSTLFKVYNGIAAAYIALMCLMSATRGDHVAFFYMLGLMADTFFFAFMFLLIFETAQTVGRRVHPAVIAATARIYALTLVINYLSKKGTFHYSTSFAVALALLIPTALVFFVSHLGRKKAESTKPADAALSWIVPAAGIILLLVGAVLSNSKPVLFVSVIFSAILFMWTFSSWRDGRKENRPPMMRAFLSSALFCVLILALLPISPVKSSFDGTFSFKGMFYTYNGQQSPTVNPNGDNPIFGDEDEDDESDEDEQQQERNDNNLAPEEQLADIDKSFRLPKMLLDLGKDRNVRRGSGKRSVTKTDLKQGRYVRAEQPKSKVTDLAFDATIRAAAPYQRLREDNGCALNIKEEDLRQKVREKRSGITFLFAVDACGSMGARERMRAVKGAIFYMLQEAYQKRDRVGMIAFRRDKADMLLPITRSVDLAQKRLAEMPTGGKTPLADGLALSLQTLAMLNKRDSELEPILIVVTDGRANAVHEGEKDPVAAAISIAEKIAKAKITSVVIDTESDFIKLGLAKKVAAAMQANYYTLQKLSKENIIHIVRNLN